MSAKLVIYSTELCVLQVYEAYEHVILIHVPILTPLLLQNPDDTCSNRGLQPDSCVMFHMALPVIASPNTTRPWNHDLSVTGKLKLMLFLQYKSS